jgi:hypothetical protein
MGLLSDTLKEGL